MFQSQEETRLLPCSLLALWTNYSPQEDGRGLITTSLAALALRRGGGAPVGSALSRLPLLVNMRSSLPVSFPGLCCRSCGIMPGGERSTQARFPRGLPLATGLKPQA